MGGGEGEFSAAAFGPGVGSGEPGPFGIGLAIAMRSVARVRRAQHYKSDRERMVNNVVTLVFLPANSTRFEAGGVLHCQL